MRLQFLSGIYIGSLECPKSKKAYETVISIKPSLFLPDTGKRFCFYSALENPYIKVKDITKTKLSDLKQIQVSELSELGLHKDWEKCFGLKALRLDIQSDVCFIKNDIIIASKNEDKAFSFSKKRYLVVSRFHSDDSLRAMGLYLNIPSDNTFTAQKVLESSFRGTSLYTAINSGCIDKSLLGGSMEYQPSFSTLPFFTEVIAQKSSQIDLDLMPSTRKVDIRPSLNLLDDIF